jgi:hypothetical protein
MRYATAIGHLRLVAEACAEEAARPPLLDDDRHPYVLAVYAFGELLDLPDQPESTDVAFVVDETADTLPWGMEPPLLRWFVSRYRIDRHPIRWFARPQDLPVTDHRIRGPLRLWDVEDGIDETAFEALQARQPELHRLEDPPSDEVRAAVERHLAATRTALDDAVERYWDHSWRSEHRGDGRYPEHTLWELAWGRRDLERALTRLHDEGDTTPAP